MLYVIPEPPAVRSPSTERRAAGVHESKAMILAGGEVENPLFQRQAGQHALKEGLSYGGRKPRNQGRRKLSSAGGAGSERDSPRTARPTARGSS